MFNRRHRRQGEVRNQPDRPAPQMIQTGTVIFGLWRTLRERVVDLRLADDLAGLYSLASRSDEPGVPCSPMVHARRSPRFTQSAPEPENDSAGLDHLRRRTIRLISDFALSSVATVEHRCSRDASGWFSVSLVEGWLCGLQR